MRSIPSREGASDHLPVPRRAAPVLIDHRLRQIRTAWGRYRAMGAGLEMTGG